MDLELRSKVALVTGGSRGLGRAIALAFAAEGARVATCARGRADIAAVATELAVAGPGPHLATVADVTSAEGIESLVAASHTELGPIDILVHNVGGSRATRFEESSDEDFAAVLDANLWPGIRLTRRLLPDLRAAGGAVTFISSIWGREAGGGVSYNVAKAAEISLAKALAREFAPHGVRVNTVAPGSILFPGGRWEQRQQSDPAGIAEFVRREIPSGRFGRPEEVAAAVVFLCSARASWVTGACLPVDGGQGRAF